MSGISLIATPVGLQKSGFISSVQGSPPSMIAAFSTPGEHKGMKNNYLSPIQSKMEFLHGDQAQESGLVMVKGKKMLHEDVPRKNLNYQDGQSKQLENQQSKLMQQQNFNSDKNKRQKQIEEDALTDLPFQPQKRIQNFNPLPQQISDQKANLNTRQKVKDITFSQGPQLSPITKLALVDNMQNNQQQEQRHQLQHQSKSFDRGIQQAYSLPSFLNIDANDSNFLKKLDKDIKKTQQSLKMMNQRFQSFQTQRSHQASISFSNKIGDNFNNIFTDDKAPAVYLDYDDNENYVNNDDEEEMRIKKTIAYKSIELKSSQKQITGPLTQSVKTPAFPAASTSEKKTTARKKNTVLSGMLCKKLNKNSEEDFFHLSPPSSTYKLKRKSNKNQASPPPNRSAICSSRISLRSSSPGQSKKFNKDDNIRRNPSISTINSHRTINSQHEYSCRRYQERCQTPVIDLNNQNDKLVNQALLILKIKVGKRRPPVTLHAYADDTPQTLVERCLFIANISQNNNKIGDVLRQKLADIVRSQINFKINQMQSLLPNDMLDEIFAKKKIDSCQTAREMQSSSYLPLQMDTQNGNSFKSRSRDSSRPASVARSNQRQSKSPDLVAHSVKSIDFTPTLRSKRKSQTNSLNSSPLPNTHKYQNSYSKGKKKKRQSEGGIKRAPFRDSQNLPNKLYSKNSTASISSNINKTPPSRRYSSPNSFPFNNPIPTKAARQVGRLTVRIGKDQSYEIILYEGEKINDVAQNFIQEKGLRRNVIPSLVTSLEQLVISDQQKQKREEQQQMKIQFERIKNVIGDQKKSNSLIQCKSRNQVSQKISQSLTSLMTTNKYDNSSAKAMKQKTISNLSRSKFNDQNYQIQILSSRPSCRQNQNYATDLQSHILSTRSRAELQKALDFRSPSQQNQNIQLSTNNSFNIKKYSSPKLQTDQSHGLQINEYIKSVPQNLSNRSNQKRTVKASQL